MIHQYPTVVRLQVHLSGNHLTIFDPTKPLDQVLKQGEWEESMLTAFFTANHLYPFACQYTYQEFPQHFIWHRLNKNWCPQLNGFAIGQLYFVAPTAEEHFYLHMLLMTVKGPMLWQDLRTFDNVVHPLFYVACLVWGLLQNDDEWQQCLTEVAGICTGDALHCLFALVMRHCEPVQPQTLWNKF